MTDVLTEFLYKYKITRCDRCHWKMGINDVQMTNDPTLTVMIVCRNCGKPLIRITRKDELAWDWLPVLAAYVTTEWKRK